MNFEQAYDPVRCLRASWELLKRAPATILLGALVPIVFQGALGFGMELLLIPMIFASGQPRPGEMPAFFPVFVAMVAVLGLFLFVFQTWIDIGYARAVREVQTQGTEPFATIFRGGDRLLRLLLARFLTLLVILAGYAVGLPGFLAVFVLGTTSAPSPLKMAALLGLFFVSWCLTIYLSLGFQFVTQIIAFEDCSATEAIARSWRLASGRRWRLILFWLFAFLISFAGALACGVGIMLAIPLIETMRIEAFLALRQNGQAPQPTNEGWGTSPPPQA